MDRIAHQSQVARPLRVPIHQISGPKNALLELKGTILVYHQRAWSGRVSIFIPVECVSLKHIARVDTRGYYKFMALPAALFVLALPFIYAARLVFGQIADVVGALVLVGLLSIMTVAAIAGLLIVRKRSGIELIVDVEPNPLRIRFWHNAGDNADRDALLTRLTSFSERANEVITYTIPKSHTWYRVRPFRAAIVKSVFFTALLLLPVQLIASYFEQPFANLFLVMPFIIYLGRYALEGSLLRFAPRGFREAVNSYHRDELKQAERHLKTVFEEEPDYLEGCLLSIQLCLERRDFTTAFKRCRQVAKSDPDLADDIAEEIWLFKRMHDRMGMAT